jgi:hypothetical protein
MASPTFEAPVDAEGFTEPNNETAGLEFLKNGTHESLFNSEPVANPPVDQPIRIDDSNPFGGSVSTVAPRKSHATAIIRWAVVGTLTLGLGGLAVWTGIQLNQNKNKTHRDGFYNPDRGYVFYSMGPAWPQDQGRAVRAGFDLVFHRKDMNAWITLRTKEIKETTPTLKEATEEAAAFWQDRVQNFAVTGPFTKTTLSGRAALVLNGEGTLDGVAVRGQTVCTMTDRMIVHLNFEAPTETFEQAAVEFARARKNLEITGEITDGTKEIGTDAMQVFASKKYPYRLTAAAKNWREVPDRQTDSRFDDLKLLDRTRTAELTVAPWKTDDLPGMRVRYISTQQRRYDNKVREVENSVESLNIRGRKALRTLLVVTTLGGETILHTTFVKGDGLVFIIQGRAPVDQRGVFEPMFDKIVDSFEVLDHVPAAPATEKTPEEPTEATKPADEPPPMPVQKTKTEEAKKPMPEPPKPSPQLNEKKMAEKSAPKTSEKTPTETPKTKRKSLDDLD